MTKKSFKETLKIKFRELSKVFGLAITPVNISVQQRDWLFQGGAMVGFAKSVGSVAYYLFLDDSENFIRGIEISANHVKSISEGDVYAKATFIHKGRTTQLWNIRITDVDDNLISIVKLTTIALPKKK